MKIKKVFIKNYKSIKQIELEVNEGLNAFIGENSVGKSNIFNAVNWLVGSVYPSFNSTLPSDHWLGDENNLISIQITYDDNNTLELAEEWELTKYNGSTETKSGLNLNKSYINTPDREKYCSAYLQTDRQIQDYLPSNRWSLLGRILQQINTRFSNELDSNTGKPKPEILKEKLIEIRDQILFSVGRVDPSSKGIMDMFLQIIQEESALQLNRPEDEFSIDLSLYDPWNFYRTLQLLVNEKDTGMPPLQASALGMGVQASITIAILKAYAALGLENKTPIFIDEPELFLHPQAQRNFHNELRKMTESTTNPDTGEEVEGIQIFYTTHSPNFIRADKFDEIFVVRKSPTESTYISTAKKVDLIKDLKLRTGIESSEEDLMLHYKNAYENTGDSQKANEAFFARKIILVEGQTESLVLPYFFQLADFDYDKHGISIVRCGSKGELDRFFRLYNEFGIPTYIIFDGDKQNEGTDDEENTKQKNKSLTQLFDSETEWPETVVNDRYLSFETTIEENLGYVTQKKGNVIKLFIELKENIKGAASLPGWVSELVVKISALETPIVSLLKTEETVRELDSDDDLPF